MFEVVVKGAVGDVRAKCGEGFFECFALNEVYSQELFTGASLPLPGGLFKSIFGFLEHSRMIFR